MAGTLAALSLRALPTESSGKRGTAERVQNHSQLGEKWAVIAVYAPWALDATHGAFRRKAHFQKLGSAGVDDKSESATDPLTVSCDAP